MLQSTLYLLPQEVKGGGTGLSRSGKVEKRHWGSLKLMWSCGPERGCLAKEMLRRREWIHSRRENQPFFPPSSIGVHLLSVPELGGERDNSMLWDSSKWRVKEGISWQQNMQSHKSERRGDNAFEKTTKLVDCRACKEQELECGGAVCNIAGKTRVFRSKEVRD